MKSRMVFPYKVLFTVRNNKRTVLLSICNISYPRYPQIPYFIGILVMLQIIQTHYIR